MPSSLAAVNVVVPPTKATEPVHRAEKLFDPAPVGPPLPQFRFSGAVSQAVDTAVPDSVLFAKYSARYWPDGQDVGGGAVAAVQLNFATAPWLVSKYSILTSCAPAVSALEAVNVAS